MSWDMSPGQVQMFLTILSGFLRAVAAGDILWMSPGDSTQPVRIVVSPRQVRRVSYGLLGGHDLWR